MNSPHALEPPNAPKIFDRPGYRVKIYPNSEITELIIKADVSLNEVFVRDSKKVLTEARPGHKHFLLVGAEGFFRLTKRARRIGAGKMFSSHLAAVACYTSNYSLALLGELYNKINKPFVPTKVFYTKEAAQDWLMEKIWKQKGGTVTVLEICVAPAGMQIVS
jgi:hypothetical protein